jgi:hypothetical protein
LVTTTSSIDLFLSDSVLSDKEDVDAFDHYMSARTVFAQNDLREPGRLRSGAFRLLVVATRTAICYNIPSPSSQSPHLILQHTTSQIVLRVHGLGCTPYLPAT